MARRRAGRPEAAQADAAARAAALLEAPPVLADWLEENFPGAERAGEVAALLRGAATASLVVTDLSDDEDRAVGETVDSGLGWAELNEILDRWQVEHGLSDVALGRESPWEGCVFRCEYPEEDDLPGGRLEFEVKLGGRFAPPVLNWLLVLRLGWCDAREQPWKGE